MMHLCHCVEIKAFQPVWRGDSPPGGSLGDLPLGAWFQEDSIWVEESMNQTGIKLSLGQQSFQYQKMAMGLAALKALEDQSPAFTCSKLVDQSSQGCSDVLGIFPVL